MDGDEWSEIFAADILWREDKQKSSFKLFLVGAQALRSLKKIKNLTARQDFTWHAARYSLLLYSLAISLRAFDQGFKTKLKNLQKLFLATLKLHLPASPWIETTNLLHSLRHNMSGRTSVVDVEDDHSQHDWQADQDHGEDDVLTQEGNPLRCWRNRFNWTQLYSISGVRWETNKVTLKHSASHSHRWQARTRWETTGEKCSTSSSPPHPMGGKTQHMSGRRKALLAIVCLWRDKEVAFARRSNKSCRRKALRKNSVVELIIANKQRNATNTSQTFYGWNKFSCIWETDLLPNMRPHEWHCVWCERNIS